MLTPEMKAKAKKLREKEIESLLQGKTVTWRSGVSLKLHTQPNGDQFVEAITQSGQWYRCYLWEIGSMKIHAHKDMAADWERKGRQEKGWSKKGGVYTNIEKGIRTFLSAKEYVRVRPWEVVVKPGVPCDPEVVKLIADGIIQVKE